MKTKTTLSSLEMALIDANLDEKLKLNKKQDNWVCLVDIETDKKVSFCYTYDEMRAFLTALQMRNNKEI